MVVTYLSNTYYLANDNSLVALAKRGDELAFEELTIRYIKLIWSVAKDYNIDGYETQDLVQEGLLSFLLASKAYDSEGKSSFKNYAIKCVKNRYKDLLKKATAKKIIPSKNLVPIESVSQEEDNEQNVEDYVLERDYLKTMLNHIYNILSEDEISIFNLYIQGYSYKDIAKQLGLEKKQVDNSLQKIKKKLRNN